MSPVLSPITYLRGQKELFVNRVGNLPHVAAENEALQKENTLLKIEVKQLTEAVSDQTLVASLNQHGWQIQPLRLVSLGNSAIFTSQDLTQIKAGQPVISGNSLVGLVKSVQAPVIKVIPLNHPEIRVAVQLETGVKGDYIYQSSHPYIINLPTNVAFNSKTIVLTLPTEQLPENLVLGQIERITSNPADPTQEATLTLDQEINSGHDFFVITKP